MSRAFDLTIMTVIVIVSVVIHTIGLELFIPGSPLYELAANGNASMNGQARADLWSQILVIWVPMLASGGIIAWVFIREFRRQAVTAARPGRPP